jgi:hypothetical protein
MPKEDGCFWPRQTFGGSAALQLLTFRRSNANDSDQSEVAVRRPQSDAHCSKPARLPATADDEGLSLGVGHRDFLVNFGCITLALPWRPGMTNEKGLKNPALTGLFRPSCW